MTEPALAICQPARRRPCAGAATGALPRPAGPAGAGPAARRRGRGFRGGARAAGAAGCVRGAQAGTARARGIRDGRDRQRRRPGHESAAGRRGVAPRRSRRSSRANRRNWRAANCCTAAGSPPVALRGRTVIVVDDGLATGSTMRAAVLAIRQQRPARLVVAVPVGAAETCALLRAGCRRGGLRGHAKPVPRRGPLVSRFSASQRRRGA